MSALAGIDIALWDLKGVFPIQDQSLDGGLISCSSETRCTNLRIAGWQSARQNQGLRLDRRRPTIRCRKSSVRHYDVS